MAVAPGDRLGVYEITSRIGAGGMGEVYRARDTKLGRDVAIKVLPEAFARDSDRVARFSREAQVLASLNHPNIAAIYGLEKTAGTEVLVLELVEGPTLADRIAQGPIPVDDAMAIARQIADALDAAHEHGIIHRDLKPANIKVREDGTVKVLDFGLAKAMQPDVSRPDVSNSPTISMAATGMGMILGTAAYMSPEQARGRPVDKRSDIWAFGCVLYEMLTGKPVFEGEDVSEILASVIKSGVNLTLLPAGTPRGLTDLIGRCLERDVRKRLRDIGDVRYELERTGTEPASRRIEHAVARNRRRALPMVAALAIVALIGAAGGWWVKPASDVPSAAMRFTFTTPQPAMRNADRNVIAVSPDGANLAYNAQGGIYVRAAGSGATVLLSGTESNVTEPVFSPDGQWIAFWANAESQLKKIPITGGVPVALARLINPCGITWAPDNTILAGQPEGIVRVSANGGMPEVVIRSQSDEQLCSPQLLPDGVSVLFTSTTQQGGAARWGTADIVAQSLGSERQVLWRGGADAKYVPTGHLVYAQGESLFALRFNLDRLEVIGDPVPVLSGLQRSVGGNTGAANYGFASNGTFAFLSTGVDQTQVRHLVWVDRSGAATRIVDQEDGYGTPRIAPDGQRIAVILNQAGNEDIWTVDIARRVRTRLTFGPERDIFPLWTPDGATITFTSARRGAQTLYSMPADGSSPPQPLTESERNQGPNSWSPDGVTLAYHETGVLSGYDLFMLARGKPPQPFVATQFRERGAAFSPDGRWVAYSSDESGREEVYLQEYPGPGGKVIVSNDGGRSPRWSANGRELFYRDGSRMMAVPMELSPQLRVGTPRLLFEGTFTVENDTSGATSYDVARDGRFLMTQPVEAQTGGEIPRPEITFIVNWFEELNRLAPVN